MITKSLTLPKAYPKKNSKIQWVAFVDQMPDPKSYSKELFRMVIHTENGLNYLVVFDMGRLKAGASFQLINITYQGIWENIKCLAYINDGHFIGGTYSGYRQFKLVESNTSKQDSPFLVELQKMEECGPISSLELIDKNEYDPKELVAVTHIKDLKSQINIYRRGITLTELKKIEVPAIQYMKIFELNDNEYYLLMNTNRKSRMFKVVGNFELKIEEEKFDEDHDQEEFTNKISERMNLFKDLNMNFQEIKFPKNDIIFSAVLTTSGCFKVKHYY